MGTVEVYQWGREVEPELWEAAFGSHAKDGRFYQIAEDCLLDQFALPLPGAAQRRYGRGRAPAGAGGGPGWRGGVAKAGAKPRGGDPAEGDTRAFCKMKLLMVGCAAGEGQLGSAEPWAIRALHEVLPSVARGAGASVIVVKDFPADYRAALGPVFERDYRRVPGMPAATLELEYASFEDYLQNRVGKVFRKNLRRKFRKLESAPPITMEVIADATEVAEELFALYWQTFERSEFQFEILSREFFERLGRDMPDKTRFFIWRQEGRIIAFNVCLVHDGVIYDLDLGLDYSVALDLHMYFVTWRDIVQWSIEQGLRMYHTGPLNYDPKLHLKLELAPQDLYARHVTGWINPFLRAAMPFMHPVRHDPIIRRFENAGEL